MISITNGQAIEIRDALQELIEFLRYDPHKTNDEEHVASRISAVQSIIDGLSHNICPTKVRIKTWDDMTEEFGLTSSGNIACNMGFVWYMEKNMPKDRVIHVCPMGDGLYSWDLNGEMYLISEDMIGGTE
jgi:hypothetical protein